MTLWERIQALLSAAHDSTLGALMEVLSERRRRRDEAAFSIALIALSAKLAKADGVVTDEEIEAFRKFFTYPPEQEGKVSMIYRLAMEDIAGFDMYARQVGKLFREEPGILEDVLDCLFHIALADGELHPDEMTLLRVAADAFNLGPRQWRRVLAGHMGTGSDDPYAILGLDPDCSDQDLKRGYLKLAKDHHPDALMARGVPAELVKISQGRMAVINTAYEKALSERSDMAVDEPPSPPSAS
jgi:DnaJ like chaperone protein